jgi:hypothetical protein
MELPVAVPTSAVALFIGIIVGASSRGSRAAASYAG